MSGANIWGARSCPLQSSGRKSTLGNNFSDIDNLELNFLDNLADAIENVYQNFENTVLFYKENNVAQVTKSITSYTNLGPKKVTLV